MNKNNKTDIWAIGIVKNTIANFIKNNNKKDIVWIYPKKSYQFYADPFGVWKDDKLYIFVEALDYRIKKGEIDCFVFDRELKKIDFFHVLSNKVHLSYPFIVEHKNKIYMIPESSQSGKTYIYEATNFPKDWKIVTEVMKNVPMIDPSIIKFQERWWLFYSLPGPNGRAMKELHIAFSDNFLSGYKEHPKNPVITGIENSRPGGTPFIIDNLIHLPVQNCKKTYGGEINILQIINLTEDTFNARMVGSIKPYLNKKYSDGLHTLSECKSVTLIDCKNHDFSSKRKWINWQRRLGRYIPFILKI
ncbi:hypothetical protein N9O74_00960 [Methylophilaceae bacterium]|nr:hypothetical protein [Methylophilaceae bacterium]